MTKPHAVFSTVGSFLTGLVAKTRVDDSVAGEQAVRRSWSAVSEAEIQNVLKLRDVLGRLNKTVAGICYLKFQALDHEDAEPAAPLPVRYSNELLEYVTTAGSVSTLLLNPATRSTVKGMLAVIQGIGSISTALEAEELAADVACYWSVLDPMLVTDLREAAGPADELPDTFMQPAAASARRRDEQPGVSVERVKKLLWASIQVYAIFLPVLIGTIHGVNFWQHGNAVFSMCSLVLGVSAAYLVRRLRGVVFPLVGVSTAVHGAPA